MGAGELFSNAERLAIDSTIRKCEQQSRIEFSIFVGHAEGDPRPFATQLHNTLVAPSRSVLIMVDPAQRLIEVVTGGFVRGRVSDAEVELAIASMQASFAAGDVAGGIRAGITMIAEHATGPKTLHA